MKVKITRPCKLYLTPDQEKPYTMGDTFEVESLDGIQGLVEVLEEEKPKKTRKKTSASKAEEDLVDTSPSNDDETEEE